MLAHFQTNNKYMKIHYEFILTRDSTVQYTSNTHKTFITLESQLPENRLRVKIIPSREIIYIFSMNLVNDKK